MYGPRQAAPPKPEKIPRVEVYWTAVTYRTVALYLVMIFAVILATLYLIHPDWYSNVIDRMSRTLGAAPAGGLLAQNQARFVNLDGKVEVKKVNSVNWQNADYNTTLNKSDLIRTGSDGAARITFVDGTTYTIKSDSFVTVEENSMSSDHTTNVGVHISSGAVDLTTGTWQSPQSKAEVSFANARASLAQNSRAAVRTDPVADRNQITVSAGAAQMQIGNQHIEIGKWQRVTFASKGPIVKTNVLAPPDLLEPVNLQPLIVQDPKRTPLHFSWAPVADAVSYTLKVSTNSMFTRVVAEKTVTDTSVDITGLESGDYFWGVTATDVHRHESAPSDPFKFTLVAQGKSQSMLLDVDGTELHGNVVEIIGRTEPGAALIINGETVADIQSDGRFRYFTQPLSTGSHEIVITGQNRRGGTAIKRVPIVIP
jgi:FecR protein